LTHAGGAPSSACWKILEALEKMGPAARAAGPMLTNHISSANPMLSAYAARALWAIQPHNALSIPCFMEKLADGGDNSQSGAQYWSLIALARIGPEARAALPLDPHRSHQRAGCADA